MNPLTLFLSSSPSLVPFFVSVLVAELRSKGALGKSPTGLDRPTAEMPLLGSALRGSSLLKSFSEATFLSKGFCLWSAMGLALSNGGSLSKRSQIGLFVVVVAGVRYYGLSYSTFSKCRAANRESLAMSPFLSSILWPILPKLVQAIS